MIALAMTTILIAVRLVRKTVALAEETINRTTEEIVRELGNVTGRTP